MAKPPPLQLSKQRLLDAAERGFAEHGFEGASLRALTRAAGLSVSAANYHFGSKDELLAAVVRRRVRPLNERRLAALDALEARAAAPALEALLDAYLRPVFERHAAARREGRATLPRQFAARLYCDPPERVQALRAEIFGEVHARFHAAFARALPKASEPALRLLQQLAIAAMVHVLSGQLEEKVAAEYAAQAARGEAPHEPLLRALIAHIAQGGRALAALPGLAATTKMAAPRKLRASQKNSASQKISAQQKIRAPLKTSASQKKRAPQKISAPQKLRAPQKTAERAR